MKKYKRYKDKEKRKKYNREYQREYMRKYYAKRKKEGTLNTYPRFRDTKALRLAAMQKLGELKCCDCGCDKYEILEINHISGGGRKEKKKLSHYGLLVRIITGLITTKDVNILCRVCNAKHYVADLLGIPGHKVLWG